MIKDLYQGTRWYGYFPIVNDSNKERLDYLINTVRKGVFNLIELSYINKVLDNLTDKELSYLVDIREYHMAYHMAYDWIELVFEGLDDLGTVNINLSKPSRLVHFYLESSNREMIKVIGDVTFSLVKRNTDIEEIPYCIKYLINEAYPNE